MYLVSWAIQRSGASIPHAIGNALGKDLGLWTILFETCGLTDLSPTRFGTTRHTGPQTYTIAHATHRRCRVYGPVF